MQPTKRARYARETITPSGYFGNSPDNVVELEDMVTPEEQDYLLEFARNNTVWDVTESQWNENGNIIYDHRVWEDRVATRDTLLKADPTGEVVAILGRVIERMTPHIREKFQVEVTPTDAAIVRWPKGAMQFPHADKELHDGPDAGLPNDFPNYDLSSLFYLNDDYEGGELFFPLQDIKFKPKPRAAYFFPGDKNYIHGVTKVTSGTRYTAPFFWTITKLGLEENDK